MTARYSASVDARQGIKTTSLNGARLERTPNPTRFDRICIAIILAVVACATAFAFSTVSSAPRAEVVPPASVVGTGAGQGHQ